MNENFEENNNSNNFEEKKHIFYQYSKIPEEFPNSIDLSEFF